MNKITPQPPKPSTVDTKPGVKAPRPSSEETGIPSFETMDRLERAVAARLTQGVSPHALYDAWFDWASHLANAPGRLIDLGLEAVNLGARFAQFQLFTDTEVTFVLTNGGHNAGILSEPGHRGRHYQIATRKTGDRYIDSDAWLSRATTVEGSWWPAWASWLEARSDSHRVAPPGIGAPSRGLVALGDAPGLYVYRR